MGCKDEVVVLMHSYLDGDFTKDEEDRLRKHLERCSDCQRHFHELNRTVTLLELKDTMEAPTNFTARVMQQLPKEKKHVKYTRWLKSHPIMTAAAVFVLLFIGTIFSAWTEENKLVVSKEDNLIIKGDTVIVPEGVTVSGDLIVKNGKLIIEGIVHGDVTLINSVLVGMDDKGLMAIAGEVHGEMKSVDRMFEWIWYNIQETIDNVFSFKTILFSPTDPGNHAEVLTCHEQ